MMIGKKLRMVFGAEYSQELHERIFTMKVSWLKRQIMKLKYKPSDHIFMIGDKLQYPKHGTGKITCIESFDGEDFYCIEMDKVRMRVLVPIGKIQKVGAV